MNRITSFHRFRQNLDMAGYLRSHFLPNFSRAAMAAADGAREISFKSAVTALRSLYGTYFTAFSTGKPGILGLYIYFHPEKPSFFFTIHLSGISTFFETIYTNLTYNTRSVAYFRVPHPKIPLLLVFTFNYLYLMKKIYIFS